MANISGIDTGTANSCVAVIEDNEPEVIPAQVAALPRNSGIHGQGGTQGGKTNQKSGYYQPQCKHFCP